MKRLILSIKDHDRSPRLLTIFGFLCLISECFLVVEPYTKTFTASTLAPRVAKLSGIESSLEIASIASMDPVFFLEMAFTPGVVYFLLNSKNNDLEDLRSKYIQLEEDFNEVMTNTLQQKNGSESLLKRQDDLERIMEFASSNMALANQRELQIKLQLDEKEEILELYKSEILNLRNEINTVSKDISSKMISVNAALDEKLESLGEKIDTTSVQNNGFLKSAQAKIEEHDTLLTNAFQQFKELNKQAEDARLLVGAELVSQGITDSSTEAAMVTLQQLSDNILRIEQRMTLLQSAVDKARTNAPIGSSDIPSDLNTQVSLSAASAASDAAVSSLLSDIEGLRGSLQDVSDGMFAATSATTQSTALLQQDVSRLTTEINELRTLRATVDALQQAEGVWNVEGAALRRMALSAEDARKEMEARMDLLQQQTAVVNSQMVSLEKGLRDRSGGLEALVGQLDAKLASAVSDLEAAISATNSDVDDSLESVSETQKSVLSDLQRLREAAAAAQFQMSVLRAAVDDARETARNVGESARTELGAVQTSLRAEIDARSTQTQMAVDTLRVETTTAVAAASAVLGEEIRRSAEETSRTQRGYTDAAVGSATEQMREQVKAVEASVEEAVDGVRAAVEDVRVEAKTQERELLTQIAGTASESRRRVTMVEEEVRRAAAASTASLDFIKSSVEMRLGQMQKDLRKTSTDLDSRLDRLDGSIEARVLRILHHTSWPQRFKRVVVGVAAAVALTWNGFLRSLRETGRKVKSRLAWFVGRFSGRVGIPKFRAQAQFRASSGSGPQIFRSPIKSSEQFPLGGSGGGGGSNARSYPVGSGMDDSVTDITFSDDLPAPLQ